MDDFDAAYPGGNDYCGWLENKAYKYIVLNEGRKYPPKHILSAASEIPVTEFSGGDQTNHVFQCLDFDVIRKDKP